jgi:hypothetical protein
MVGNEIDKALKSSGADAKVTTLQNATREQVRGAFAQIAHEAKSEDALVVMLVGHGAFDGIDYKINLQGPDLSAAELAGLLNRVPAKRQLVVNMTSSSGGSIDVLRKPDRIVITATKSGSEKNATVFAKYWAEALGDPAPIPIRMKRSPHSRPSGTPSRRRQITMRPTSAWPPSIRCWRIRVRVRA